MRLDEYKHEDSLALDTAKTVEEIFRLTQQLQEKYPEETSLHLHIGYNWRVAQLLDEAETIAAT